MSIAKGLEHLGFTSLVDFVLRDDNGTTVFEEWNSDKQQPTLEEIQAANDAWQAEYDNDYARKRALEYPSIDELIVALWENVVEERTAAVISLEGKRQAVKTKYPK